ncbi:DNA topoisomerase III [Endozoicomonadaceae bacterium StTr2]
MRLFIAEKPSLGRAIAEVLPGNGRKNDGYIDFGSEGCVTWCIGHLLEQVEPDAYDAAWKPWRLEHLPIVPEQWQLKPRKGVQKQLTVIRKLLKNATEVIHAGDPDREGQLLVDEVLAYLKLKKSVPVQRCLINDLNPPAVRKAIAELKDNRSYAALSRSALARSRADWLYGINMTRALTVSAQKKGYNGLLSVGRVQTPVLGLVVRRDIEIENFKPHPYYEVLANLKTAANETYQARWKPSEACQPWMDEEGRVLNKQLAETVIRRITGKDGMVEKAEQKTIKEQPPLPYSLSSLQIDAAKRYGMNARKVLDVCQSLYEKKLITYPRSDCRYLPEEHLGQVAGVTNAISSGLDEAQPWLAGADLSLKSRAWNDKKVEAHHAIIPTQRAPSRLIHDEKNIYSLIARQYIAQFYPACISQERRIEVRIDTGLFVASRRAVEKPGWKTLYNRDNKEREDSKPPLPVAKKGDIHLCEGGELLEKETHPPLPFTDASLLSAMTGIARFVKEPEVRKILRETDGLGTEATRAGIIELLFKRQYLKREGRSIHASETGRSLIGSVPESVSQPDRTARWESQLDSVARNESRYDDFMVPLVQELGGLVGQVSPVNMPALPSKKRQFKRKKAKARL